MIQVAVLILALAAGPTVEQQLGNATCRLTVSAREIPLSGAVTITVSIEGRAPVEVEPPRPVTKSPDWRVRPVQSRIIALPEGRERWEQTFELEPFQTGSSVPLPLEPICYRTGNELRDWQLHWAPVGIAVTSSVPEADLGHAKTVTAIEPIPANEHAEIAWWIIPMVCVSALLGLGGIAIRVYRRAKQSESRKSPSEQALTDLQRLDSGNVDDLALVADILRRFIEAQYQLQATRQTSAEFLTALRTAQVLAHDQIQRLQELLRGCDLVKFAGASYNCVEVLKLVGVARQFILENSPPAHSADNAKSVPTK